VKRLTAIGALQQGSPKKKFMYPGTLHKKLILQAGFSNMRLSL